MMDFDYLRNMGDGYWQWLIREVALYGDKTYYLLLRALYLKPFYFINDFDFDIEESGLYLRAMYIKNWKEELIFPKDCTCLEALIALAFKAESMYDEIGYRYWFHLIIENLGLDIFDDERFIATGGYERVNYILARWLSRSYSKRGEGSCFPLSKLSSVDQRKISMVSQLEFYIQESCWLIK